MENVPKLGSRHFEFIAECINSLDFTELALEPYPTEKIATHFATKLKQTNPRFNSERFIFSICKCETMY